MSAETSHYTRLTAFIALVFGFERVLRWADTTSCRRAAGAPALLSAHMIQSVTESEAQIFLPAVPAELPVVLSLSFTPASH